MSIDPVVRPPSPSPDTAAHVVDRLIRLDLTLAVAESLCGGLLALRLTETPESGKVFRGGVVAYLTGVKHELLGVPAGPVVSATCAETMASGVARLLDADVALATTGVAGPATQEGQQVGTVFIGYSILGEQGSSALRLSPAAPPDHIREASVDAALTLLDHQLRARH
jgi:PncC family amidohydrolase